MAFADGTVFHGTLDWPSGLGVFWSADNISWIGPTSRLGSGPINGWSAWGDGPGGGNDPGGYHYLRLQGIPGIGGNDGNPDRTLAGGSISSIRILCGAVPPPPPDYNVCDFLPIGFMADAENGTNIYITGYDTNSNSIGVVSVNPLTGVTGHFYPILAQVTQDRGRGRHQVAEG